MNSKVSNKSPKPNQLNQKSPQIKRLSKEKSSQPNNEDPKPISTGEKEIDTQSLLANKSQKSDLNILSKNSDMTKIKTYEIQSDEQVTFLLNFEIVEEKMKITVIKKDSFPQKKYENYYTLEDFITINKWLKKFNNIETLLYFLELLTNNEYFAIKQKDKNALSLFIIFPIDHLDKIGILLLVNEINNLDLFLQLISKITEIESKENNEITFFNEKIDNLNHSLQSNEEVNKAREEGILKNNQKENKSVKSNNLEEIKDVFKLQFEKTIKNDNDNNKNTNEVTKEEKRREEKRREEKRR